MRSPWNGELCNFGLAAKGQQEATAGEGMQPGRFVHLPDTDEGDNGGVHFNSGIPNKAFYLTAVGIGGFVWEAPGYIWYESLKASSVKTEFQEFADTTYWKAEELYGAGSAEQQAVLAAWREVGIRISGVVAGSTRGRSVPAGRGGGAGREGDTLAALTRQIEALSDRVKALAEEVSALKGQQ
jgi:thermolysin metallopeptidase-like protein